MSVFADFQRMWMKRFPENSLSNEWEDDVRVSLQRHKQKVVDLSKELEQEMLYVEYLERLLGDVEEFRKAGGDPSVPIQQTNEEVAGAEPTFDKQTEKSDDIGSATNKEHTSASINGVCVMCNVHEIFSLRSSALVLFKRLLSVPMDRNYSTLELIQYITTRNHTFKPYTQ